MSSEHALSLTLAYGNFCGRWRLFWLEHSNIKVYSLSSRPKKFFSSVVMNSSYSQVCVLHQCSGLPLALAPAPGNTGLAPKLFRSGATSCAPNSAPAPAFPIPRKFLLLLHVLSNSSPAPPFIEISQITLFGALFSIWPPFQESRN